MLILLCKHPWNRVKTTFFTTGGWKSTGEISVNEMISFFYSYWVLYKLHEQEDRLSLILVLRVSCLTVFCVVAATCENPKTISSCVNGCTYHDREFRFKQSQKLLWKLVLLGILVEQGEPATLDTVETHALTHFSSG